MNEHPLSKFEDENPKLEDFEIVCNTDVGSTRVGYKNGGVNVSVSKALELLLLKSILEKPSSLTCE